MKKIGPSTATLALMLLPFAVAGCDSHPQSVGEHYVYRDVLKEVPRPCPAARPPRPAPLARPLPTAPRALIDILTAKLKEVLGAGGYVDQADAALAICTKPVPPAGAPPAGH